MIIINVEILIKLKEYIDKYNFILDDISVRSELEDEPMDEMITKGDDDIIDFLNVINDIDKLLNALTVDIRDSMSAEDGFDCDDYHTWNNHLKHNPLNLVGLCETFTDALKQLEFYVTETLRGYRILTQPAYDQEVFSSLAQGILKERSTE